MAKRFRAPALGCCIALLSGVFSSCSQTMQMGDGYTALRAAIQNSLGYKTYYIQEMILKDNLLDKKTVNLLCDQDKKYQPIVKNGRLSDYKVEIHMTQKDLPVSDIYCGASKSSSGEVKDCLFRTKYQKNAAKSESVCKTVETKRIEDFIESDEFKAHYSIQSFLKELSNMGPPDLDFSTPSAKAQRKNKRTVLAFVVSAEYLKRYESRNGKPSVFAGSDRVEIELIYDRIASVVTYCSYSDEEFGLTFEKSPYKLFITYYGPKFELPHFDEKAAQNTLEWVQI